MARIPMITRTVKATIAKVMCLDITNEQPFTKEITLPRTYKDDNEILKNAKAIIDSDAVKAVHVVSSEVAEALYGMSEQKFIDNADILPPRGAKNVEENT